MKKLSDYVHLYVGCEVKTVDGAGINCGFFYPEVWLEDGKVESNGINVFFPDTKKAFVMNFGQCQLILRPLSDMTYEEKKEYGYASQNGVDKNILPRIPAGRLIDHYYSAKSAELTRWLLSKSFDLFGLIESDLAIDKTKINQTA